MERLFTDNHRVFLTQEDDKACGELMRLKESLIAEVPQRVKAIFKEIKEELLRTMTVKEEKSLELTEKLIRLVEQTISFLSDSEAIKLNPREPEMTVFREFVSFFPEQVSQHGLMILQKMGMQFKREAFRLVLNQKIDLKELDYFLRYFSFGGKKYNLDTAIGMVCGVVGEILKTQDITTTDMEKIFSFGLDFINTIVIRDRNMEDRDSERRSGFAKFCTGLLRGVTNNKQSLPIEKAVLIKEIIRANGENGSPGEEFCLSLLGVDNSKMLDGLWYKYLDTYVVRKNFYRYVWTCMQAISQNKSSLQRNKVICEEVRDHWARYMNESREKGFHTKCGGARDVESAVDDTQFWELFYEILERGAIDEDLVSAMLNTCLTYVEFLYQAISLVKDKYGRHKNREWIHDIVEKSSPLASSCCESAPDTKDCFSDIKKKGEKSWKMVFKMIMEKKLSPKELVDILKANKRKKFSKLLESIVAGKYTMLDQQI